MKIFLTGATGTVGREVFRALSLRGADVHVGARSPGAAGAALLGAAELSLLDYEADVIPAALFQGIDAFFFMTPLIANQVAASRRVLDAAVDAGVPHVVRLSSRSAGWDQRSELRAWHREIDEAVRGSGATWTILRPCSFFQNFITHQAETIRMMSSIIVPQGRGLIPYIDAMDIGDAAAECLLRPDLHAGATHVLTGGRAYGAKGVAAEIDRVIGKPLTYIDIEEEQARAMMLQSGTPDWLVEAGLSVFARAKAGGEASVDPALTQILGRPATGLSEFVERNQDAWS